MRKPKRTIEWPKMWEFATDTLSMGFKLQLQYKSFVADADFVVYPLIVIHSACINLLFS